MEKIIVESRFENVSQDVIDLMEQVRDEWFKSLSPARIRVLFDTKKRVVGKKLILGRIMKANDLIRRLTETFVPGGCDYVLFLDKIAFTHMDPDDRIRLIRHELRHCFYNPFAKNVWGIIPHDIEDFEAEIALNKTSAGWAKRVAQITQAIYDQQKDDNRQPEPKAVVTVQKQTVSKRRARAH